jgi:hypothetical protein
MVGFFPWKARLATCGFKVRRKPSSEKHKNKNQGITHQCKLLKSIAIFEGGVPEGHCKQGTTKGPHVTTVIKLNLKHIMFIRCKKCEYTQVPGLDNRIIQEVDMGHCSLLPPVKREALETRNKQYQG